MWIEMSLVESNLFLRKLYFRSVLKLFWWKIFLHTPSWPPCFRDLGLRQQPRADLSAAACFPGDNNSLIPEIELYFPSPSSSILLTFTFHPSLHLHLPPPVGSHTRSRHDGGAPSCGHSAGEGWKTNQNHLISPLLLSSSQIDFEAFHLFLICLSSLELPGITWNQALSQLDAASFILFRSLFEFEGCSFPQ